MEPLDKFIGSLIGLVFAALFTCVAYGGYLTSQCKSQAISAKYEASQIAIICK